jgi:hypothetical protein
VLRVLAAALVPWIFSHTTVLLDYFTTHIHSRRNATQSVISVHGVLLVANRDVAGSDLHQSRFQFGALDPSVMVS